KQQWCEAVSELDALIESSCIDRRKFNRGNQAKWIEKITAWAHGIGVTGDEGRGTCWLRGVKPELLVGTFGKGFGVSGAAVLC
ncbi:hypothetical protein MJN76_35005, partial [Salmonella enterica subsp. enterica serovar Anatum]|nr:hypothetical protein [Salmonella enterica subsp. enterica serovar Anatum]